MRISPFIKHTALALAIAAAGLSDTANAKTFRWSYQGDATSMDPMALNETFTLGFQGNIYETLAGYDGELKLVPLLAESWENTEPTKWVVQAAQGRQVPRRLAVHGRRCDLLVEAQPDAGLRHEGLRR